MSAKPAIKYRFENEVSLPSAPPAPPVVGLANQDENLSIPSPVNALQTQIEAQFRSQSRTERWSPRRTTAFVLLTCGTFWAFLIGGLTLAF
jgi:hypothetical protein